jgi:hypothetical protein
MSKRDFPPLKGVVSRDVSQCRAPERSIAKKSYFPLDGEGHMNDHSRQESVNSRRSFIVEFGGVPAAAAALTKTTSAEALNAEVCCITLLLVYGGRCGFTHNVRMAGL